MSLPSIKKCNQIKSPTHTVPHLECVDQMLLGSRNLPVGRGEDAQVSKERWWSERPQKCLGVQLSFHS